MAPSYFFAYQIRISGPTMLTSQEPFYKCQLTRRHWKIIKSPTDIETVDGEGVVGYYPTITEDMEEPFVYESCSPTNVIGTRMEGWFEFRYIEGPNKGHRFKAMIEPFYMELEEGTEIVEDPRFEDWMRS